MTVPTYTRRTVQAGSRNSFRPKNAWKSDPMTDTQQGRILRELDRRLLAPGLADALRAAVLRGQTRDGSPATKGSASDLIDWLATKAEVPATARAAASGRYQPVQNEPVREAGFYRTEDGRVFKVQESKRNPGRFYAAAVTAHGWDYDSAKGMVYHLTPEQKMTTDDILQFGIHSEVCAICSTPLEDPVSKFIGIGPSCGPKTIGKDAYKAAAKVAKADPQVAEQLAAIKAVKDADKARREAETQQAVRAAVTAAPNRPIDRNEAILRIVEAEALRIIEAGNDPEQVLDPADSMTPAITDMYWKIAAARHEAIQEAAAEEAKAAWKASVERF